MLSTDVTEKFVSLDDRLPGDEYNFRHFRTSMW